MFTFVKQIENNTPKQRDMRTLKEIENWVYAYNKELAGRNYFDDVQDYLLNFDNEENEDLQKWAFVDCTLENYGIRESQNLTKEEECELYLFLENLQQEFREQKADAIDHENTERWLMYN